MTRLLLPLAVLSLARAVRALTAELAAGRWWQGRGRATSSGTVTFSTSGKVAGPLSTPWADEAFRFTADKPVTYGGQTIPMPNPWNGAK